MNQMMFVVLAIALLGVLLVPTFRMTLNRQQILMSTESANTATAVGQELIEEISARKFDELNCNYLDAVTDPAQFSASMGLDGVANKDTAGKLWTYDDIDDFNGYTAVTSTPRLGDFLDTVSVYYVTDANPEIPSGTKTYFKRVDVKVWNKYLPTQAQTPSSIMISKVFAYRNRLGT